MGGHGPVVLLMHGWPDERTIWRHQLRALRASGYRAIAVDWIGHGESSIPKDRSRYRIPEVSADVAGLMDALGIEQAHLVAHDYGATVCWEFAAQYGHRLLSYCALSVGPSIEILRDILRGNLIRYHWLFLHGMDGLSRWVYFRNGGRRFELRFASHQDRSRIRARLAPGQDRTFWTIWEKANPAHDVVWRWLREGRRQKVPVRTMGIYSTGDEWMTRGQMRRGERHVTAVWRYEEIDGGHWVQLEKPDEVNALLLNWLSKD
ncbi:alpha/beta fold hydrolase [Aestuariibius sp. 2305UL40-4]